MSEAMLSESAIYTGTIYFSYNQFNVFDRSVKLPGCAWTDGHYKQGFARRQRNVAFSTLLEFGHGDLAVHLAPYAEKHAYQRVIEVPIEVPSGEVVLEGPEEDPDKRTVQMPCGHYRLIAAQAVTGEDREAIDVYFERLSQPLARSRIIVADDELDPPSPLLESVEVA